MTVSRRLLGKIDRALLSELDHVPAVQLVKVPVSDAVWSTWRRYCDAAGVPMGRGLAMMLESELAAMVNEGIDGLAEKLAERETAVAGRETAVSEREAEVERRVREVEIRERQVAEAAARLPTAPMTTGTLPKLGRN